MKIEIWSDVMCPYCYIGKRRLENALRDFPEREQVQLEWKSFQLNPSLQTDPSLSVVDFMVKMGIPLDRINLMNKEMAGMAAREGLEFNYEKVIIANSLRAHMFAHFAKREGKQQEAEELLFQSYFRDGANIDDLDTLISLGRMLGLDTEALEEAMLNQNLDVAVRKDMERGKELGIGGVPFFVFDNKYAMPGAQTVEAFRDVLTKAFEEYKK